MARLKLPRTRPSRLLALCVVATLLVAGGVLWLRPASAEAAIRTSEKFVQVPAAPGSADRIRIDTTLFVPESATAAAPAPAVLLAHGFGGDKADLTKQARRLAERGLVVLTYSARGFGYSGGQIWLNHPDHEIADASHLLDYLATLDRVALDAPGDPRVGVSGASYGGALSLLLAGTDDRVDVIAPVITYNDLAKALLPNAATTGEITADTPAAAAFAPQGVFKKAWAGLLFSAGSATVGSLGGQGTSGDGQEPAAGAGPGEGSAGAGGGSSASGAHTQGGPAQQGLCGRFSAQICRAYQDVAVDGVASPATRQLLHTVSPESVTDNITIPTLLVQGQRDTLFGLGQADANARQISAAGGNVKLAWYAGGHADAEPGKRIHDIVGDWLTYHLTGEGDAPTTGFSYGIAGPVRDQDDETRNVRRVEAPAYPGLHGGHTDRTDVALTGPAQRIVRPPGGTPSAVSGLPSLSRLTSSSRLSGQISFAPPNQSAMFGSAPLDSELLVTGSSRVTLRISAAGANPADSEAVLFAKLYDVGPNGDRSLPANAVSAFRLPELPRDGSPVEVTVTLPGIVHPFEAGHSMQLVIGTTDRAYAVPDEPAAYRVALVGGTLSAPLVAGSPSQTNIPIGQLLGIAGVLLAAFAIALVTAVRRRNRDTSDPALASTPLVIEGLTKSYPGKVTAVDGVSLRVEPGQVLGLLGPNGAGKTTTLRMLLGLVRPTAGEIRVFGHRIRPGAPVLSRIGSFVEGPGFLPHLSGMDNLRLFWASTGRAKDSAHLEEVLEIAGLGDAVHRKVRTYSQGMRQRLAIAQAMLGLPELLVLDEPTNGLDPPQIHQMREVLLRYAATGRTVLISSHLLAEVEQTCTHVVVMHRGALVTAGEVGEIVAAGGAASFRVDRPDAAAETLRSTAGVTGVEVEGSVVHADLGGIPRSGAVAALVRAGISVEQAGPRRRLEDAFLQLVGEGSEA